ncbi:MAG: hypothetical protein ITD35_01555, partial [Nitrospira sp.]|nr:hypothetical protein [Nitrospira sp.]
MRPAPLALLPQLSPYLFCMTGRKGFNSLYDLMRSLHGCRAILARHCRSRASADCVKKRCQLQLQRFFISPLQLLNFDGRLLPRLDLTARDRTVACLEIDRDLTVL